MPTYQRASTTPSSIRRDGFLLPSHEVYIPLLGDEHRNPHETWIKSCRNCHSYVLANPLNQPGSCDLPSHHYRVVYTDGACLNNGYYGARCGLGIAFTPSSVPGPDVYAIPVTAAVDPAPVRTSQRAELLAAIRALEKIRDDGSKMSYAGCTGKLSVRRRPRWKPAWIVASDSQYVVKGMTIWLSGWKRRGGRKPNGEVPANYELFLRLEAVVKEIEGRNVRVGFLHLPRGWNSQADGLASRAAKLL